VRRNDREITDQVLIDAILFEAQVCRLGLADEGGPYIVPMCFGYDGTALLLHSAPEGQKITMIQANPRCCFEVDLCDGIVKGKNACSWGMHYRSVIGFGRATILTDPGEKKHGLNCIMHQYQGGTHEFSDEDIRSVAVIRIAIESMTAKTSKNLSGSVEDSLEVFSCFRV
jgi:nitroimidazol reductase NimA-like FMN-containing flavoprotein (pyridoxamine 5'-phosphate oxidase superfamily)